MTEINYDLSDSKTLEDTVDNVVEYLTKDFSEFNLNDLFTIRDNSEPKSKPTKEFYINVNDYAALEYAVGRIRVYFCHRILHSRISERLNLQAGEYPFYWKFLWKIAFAFPFITPERQIAEGKGRGQGPRPTESDSLFRKQVKEIVFDEVEPLERDNFNENITYLDKFITETLSLISPEVVIEKTSKLLESCLDLPIKMRKNTLKTPGEKQLKYLMASFTESISDFFNLLIENCKDINGENPFKDIVMRTGEVKSTKTNPELLWHKFSSNPFPEHLTNEDRFQNSAEYLTISLKIKGKEPFSLLGAELKRSTLSRNMIPGDNFKSLAGVFRESMGYILSNRYSCYILSDVQRTLYFELPVEDGTWESISDNQVKLKKNLRYMIIDHTTTRGEGDLTLQTMMALKIFDGLKRYTNDRLCGVGADNRELEYHRMDRVKESDGYNKFMESFIKEGFRTKSGSNQKKSSNLGKPPDNANEDSSDDDIHNPHCTESELGSKRGPSQSLQSATLKKSALQGTDEFSDEIGDIYPTDVLFAPEDYKVLERYSNTTSTKFYLSMEECLEVFDLRYKMNLDQKKILVKLFDIYWIQDLHSRVYGGADDDDCELISEGKKKFHQSDSNVMYLLEDNEDLEDHKYVEQRIKLTYLRELIALNRIECWNSSHPGEQINTAKLLQHGWLILKFPERRLYGGPFLAFENLDFIHRNELDETPKRMQSFEHQERLLSRAGIKHNDLKSSNYCFDYNDECFIIDFGLSSVDDDEIFDKYELSDLMSPD